MALTPQRVPGARVLVTGGRGAVTRHTTNRAAWRVLVITPPPTADAPGRRSALRRPQGWRLPGDTCPRELHAMPLCPAAILREVAEATSRWSTGKAAYPANVPTVFTEGRTKRVAAAGCRRPAAGRAASRTRQPGDHPRRGRGREELPSHLLSKLGFEYPRHRTGHPSASPAGVLDWRAHIVAFHG
jgi:hypothetical protein